MKQIELIALETYSIIGGLQNFNRRLIKNLGALSSELNATISINLIGDRSEDLPAEVLASAKAYGKSKLRFVADVLSSSRRTDVLLIGHINLLPVAWMARLINPKLKLVLFVHGDEVWNDPIHRRMRVYEPWLLRAVHRVASVSNYTAQRMSAAFRVPASRFVELPNAIDERSPDSMADKAPASLLVVSRLGSGDRQKNIHETLRAFALVSKRLPHSRIDIVGDGVMRPELEALARSLGLAEHCVFHGRVSSDELMRLYAQSQAFALPSSKEGFGIVYLEAWQFGLPVICAAEGASHEIVSDGIDGIVTPCSDIEAMADAIYVLLSDSDRARAMGSAGRDKVAAKYLNQHFKANLATILSEAAGSPLDQIAG